MLFKLAAFQSSGESRECMTKLRIGNSARIGYSSNCMVGSAAAKKNKKRFDIDVRMWRRRDAGAPHRIGRTQTVAVSFSLLVRLTSGSTQELNGSMRDRSDILKLVLGSVTSSSS